MDLLLSGLAVSAIGMIIVFIGLAIIIFCITLLRGAPARKSTKPGVPQGKAAKDVSTDDTLQVVLGTAVALAMEQSAQEQLVAVLTAAVAAVWECDNGFVVRRVRRIENSTPWQKAGREEQIYSRM